MAIRGAAPSAEPEPARPAPAAGSAPEPARAPSPGGRRLPAPGSPGAARLLADPRLADAGSARPAADLLRRAQRAQGNDAVARALADRSAGRPLPPASEQEQGARLGRSFADVRLHTDERAAELARGVGAKAFTRGRDVYFGAGRYSPESAEGKRLLGHELAHVAQHQNAAAGGGGASSPAGELEAEARAAGAGRSVAVRGRAGEGMVLREPGDGGEDPATLSCSADPPVTMPEPITCEAPAQVSTSITLPAPTLGSDPAPGAPEEQRIELDVPVESSQPIVLYAVPAELVFASEEEAATPSCQAGGTSSPPAFSSGGLPTSDFVGPPVTTFGGIGWTTQGPIEVVYVSGDFVVTTNYVKFATGAAAMSLARTSEGLMLVDAGVEIGAPNGLPGNPRQDLAQAAVQELTRHVGGERIVKVLVTHQHADHINLLPLIAEHVEMGTIQVTARQAGSPVFRRVLDAVEQAQARYRSVNLPARIEAEMAPERDAWLRERPLADQLTPERAEAAWRSHVEARVQAAQAQVRFPRIELIIGGAGGQPILVEAELHRSPGQIEARLPAGTTGGGTITEPLRQGAVTAFTHPDADAPGRLQADAHSANYILTLPDATQLIVVADPRDQDLARLRANFERALRTAGHEARFRLVEAGHHAQRGFVTSGDWLVEATSLLSEIADQRGQGGERAQSAVVVGGAESRISPAHAWLARSMGYEAYVTTDARTVEMLSILDASGERVAGLTGEPRAGGRPSQALVMRAGLEIASLRQRIQALDQRIQESANADDVTAKADLESRLAETRRLLREYMEGFNDEIGRGSRDRTRPGVAPAPGVEPADSKRRALVDHLDRTGAAEATPSRLAPLTEPVLVLIDRTQGVALTPQQDQIRQHLQEIERIKAELEAGTPAEGRRVHLLGEMEGLRQLLRGELAGLEGGEADFVQREIARLDAGIRSLEGALHVETVTTPDPASGGRNRTRIVAEQPINPDWSLSRQRMERGFGVAGRVFGSVMVVHSVSAQSDLADRIQAGDTTALEAVAGTAHNVHGFTVGIRMARLMPVHFGEFAVLAVLDFTAAAAADYDTRDEANTAIAYSAFSNALNLALFAIGGALMRSPNPWVAGSGFVIMLLGEPILHVTGAAAAFERWMSFEPSEVTGVEQELRDLMREYRIVVGALELSQRDLDDLATQGASDPAALREAAQRGVAEHRGRAQELEPDIVAAFESGYARARTSYSGLSGLDTLREAFSDLQARVWAGTERAPGSDAFQDVLGRFQAIERSLDLSGASADEIRGMEQWASLDDQMDSVHDPLFDQRPDDIDWADLLEDMRELERMFQNARYRLAPAEQGRHRLSPLLGEGTTARATYEAELRDREERYSRFVTRLSSLGGGAELPIQPWEPLPPARLATAHAHEEQLEPGAPAPGYGRTPEGILYRISIQAIRDVATATSNLRRMRTLYEGAAEDLAAAFDRARLDELWGSSADLERRYAELLSASGMTRRFHLLQARETALGAAMGQARSLALLDRTASPATTEELGEELVEAQRAIARRRSEHGLIFESEIGAARAEIRQAEEQQAAVLLGGALDRQIAPHEGEALRSDALEDFGRGVGSARSQLARLGVEQARQGGGALRLYRMGEPSGALVDPATGDMAPIVGWTGQSLEVITMAGHANEMKVVPINAAAIAELGGTGPRSVRDSRLWPVSVEELAASRRAATAPGGVQRAAEGGPGAPPPAADAVRRAVADPSSGAPLPGELAPEARRLAIPPGRVRLHTDAHAAGLAGGLQAKAFARGEHVYFAAGRFAPGTAEGRRLLTHELTHVAQSRRPEAGAAASSPEALEREAEQAGSAASQRPPVPARERAPAGGSLLRSPDPDAPPPSTETWLGSVGVERPDPAGDVAELAHIDAQLSSMVITDAARGELERRRATVELVAGLRADAAAQVDLIALRREAQRRQQGAARGVSLEEAGPSRVTVPLRMLVGIPEPLDAPSLYGQVAEDPASEGAADLASRFILDRYLTAKVDWPVTIELFEPGDGVWFLFTVAGETVIASRELALPLTALDTVSPEPLSDVSARASRIVEAASLEAAFDETVATVAKQAEAIVDDPRDFARNESLGLLQLIRRFSERLGELEKQVDPADDWLVARLRNRREALVPVLARLEEVDAVAQRQHRKEWPATSTGETYDRVVGESENVVEEYGWRALRGLGNIFTLGGQGRQTENAQMYRRGEISAADYDKNWVLNIVRVGFSAVVEALGAGRVTGPALRFLGVQKGTLAASVAAGSAEGIVGGLSESLASDLFAKTVATVSSSPGVVSFHERTIGGIDSYLAAMGWGGMFGAGFGAGGHGFASFSAKTPRSLPQPGRPGLLPAPDQPRLLTAPDQPNLVALKTKDLANGDFAFLVEDPASGRHLMVQGNRFTGNATVLDPLTGELVGSMRGGVIEAPAGASRALAEPPAATTRPVVPDEVMHGPELAPELGPDLAAAPRRQLGDGEPQGSQLSELDAWIASETADPLVSDPLDPSQFQGTRVPTARSLAEVDLFDLPLEREAQLVAEFPGYVKKLLAQGKLPYLGNVRDYVLFRWGKESQQLPRGYRPSRASNPHGMSMEARVAIEAGHVAEKIQAELRNWTKNKRRYSLEFYDPVREKWVEKTVIPDFMPTSARDASGRFLNAENPSQAFLIADSKYTWELATEVRLTDQVAAMMILARDANVPFYFLLGEGRGIAPQVRQFAQAVGVEIHVVPDVSSQIR